MGGWGCIACAAFSHCCARAHDGRTHTLSRGPRGGRYESHCSTLCRFACTKAFGVVFYYFFFLYVSTKERKKAETESRSTNPRWHRSSTTPSSFSFSFFFSFFFESTQSTPTYKAHSRPLARAPMSGVRTASWMHASDLPSILNLMMVWPSKEMASERATKGREENKKRDEYKKCEPLLCFRDMGFNGVAGRRMCIPNKTAHTHTSLRALHLVNLSRL